jgi:hypothetical protein
MIKAPTPPDYQIDRQSIEKDLKDKFAMAALHSILSSGCVDMKIDPVLLAKRSYAIAEAMIIERDNNTHGN